MAELAGILILGVMAQWIAGRWGFPAILPLILIGLAAGPFATLITSGGEKLIDPARIFNEHGEILNHFVALSVGVILFEGGLTLKFKEVRSVASTVRNLTLLGPFISMFGGGLIAHYVLGVGWSIALLFGALIIVTGPTVIMPILRSTHPNKKIATILRWEGIITDPIGALFAVIVYEFIVITGPEFHLEPGAIGLFFKTIGIGIGIGVAAAYFMIYMLRNRLIAEFLINVVSLGAVVFAFAGADLLASESGLISVTIMGMIMGNSNVPKIEEILNFKETMTILLISILFIVLSANIDIEQLELLGSKSVLVLAAVIFLLRPLSVFICSIGSDLTIKEKIFVSFIGPRGIVAAAVASIFSLHILENVDLPMTMKEDAELLIPLTFLIILGTVILNSALAKPVAKALKVTIKEPNGVIILGATLPARMIAQYLNRNNIHTVLVDTSDTNVNAAKIEGLEVIHKNILSDDLMDDINLLDIGFFVGMSSNTELNILATRKFRRMLGEDKVFRLVSSREIKYSNLPQPEYLLFKPGMNYNMLMAMTEKSPQLKEYQIKDAQHLRRVLAQMKDQACPVFLNGPLSEVRVFRANLAPTYFPGDILSYFGTLPENIE